MRSFVIGTLHQILTLIIKEDEMSEACSMSWWRAIFMSESLKQRDHLGVLGTEWENIIKLDVRESVETG
jgi:hypothetical protein